MDYIITTWPRPFKIYVVKDVSSEKEAWEAFHHEDFDYSSMLLEEGEENRAEFIDIRPDLEKHVTRHFSVPEERDIEVKQDD